MDWPVTMTQDLYLAEKDTPESPHARCSVTHQTPQQCGVIHSPHSVVKPRSFVTSLWYVCRWVAWWGRSELLSFCSHELSTSLFVLATVTMERSKRDVRPGLKILMCNFI